jgi:PAS domain S-box-containing protein
MISTSITLMTVIDLAVVTLALLTFRYASAGGFFRRRSRGRVLIMLGVSTYALFYSADLLLMYGGEVLFGPDEAAMLTEVLRSSVLSLVAFLGVGFTAAGFLATSLSQTRDERRLSLMADALPLAVAYIDPEERYQFTNRRYAGLHGRVPEDIIGARMRDVVRPDLYAIVHDYHDHALRGEAQTYEHRAKLDIDGGMHDMHVDLVPDVAADGRVAGFFLLVLDVTNRVQLEREVVRAGEAERLSVARDLHDGLGQALTGISLALGALARKLAHEGSQHVATVNQLTSTAQRTIEQARQYTHLLAPTLQGGLFAALRTLATEVSALYEVECFSQCHCPPENVPIGPSAAMHLYRIAQESVNNAARHGRAGTIRIECRVEGSTFMLEVVDDGLGIPAADAREEGMGLKSMYYRARMIGGLLQITAPPDGGTEVSCSAPLASLRGDVPTGRESGEEVDASR